MPTKTFLKIHVEIAYYSFIFYSIGIEITNTFLHSRSSPKTRPDSRPKRHKTIPLGAAHSHMAHMREDSPHPPGLKATWKWPIHKALLTRLAQTVYLQNHFSRHSILLPMKVFLSLILPFLKEKRIFFFLVFPCTVESRFTDIHLIWTPIYNGQFCLSQLKAYIFSIKTPR